MSLPDNSQKLSFVRN